MTTDTAAPPLGDDLLNMPLPWATWTGAKATANTYWCKKDEVRGSFRIHKDLTTAKSALVRNRNWIRGRGKAHYEEVDMHLYEIRDGGWGLHTIMRPTDERKGHPLWSRKEMKKMSNYKIKERP